ncbi:MAG: hypothetical protein H6831_16445 [Planctomycetes bacterium]|nr:hypothetical protein [Planctomycetota bacterium]MCB9905991.1 hypothetical protein [Planctomycetota bacterium]
MRFFSLLGGCLLFTLASCSAWRPAAEYDSWTLYVQSGDDVEPAPYEATVFPALLFVEEQLGPFRDHVNIHAHEDGVTMDGGGFGRASGGGASGTGEVPGIGPARVRAFHTRSKNKLFSRSKIVTGTPEPGTMVHELVHARFAERPDELPLWFEEGYASLLGDGVLNDGRWTFDGLACWQWRELREQEFTDADLARLLEIGAGDAQTARENVLVHFVGWAIVFDLYRETGHTDPDLLLMHFGHGGDPVVQARERLEHTLADETPVDWMERLKSDDPSVRMATAKGSWKLVSRAVLTKLLRALETEDDDEVRVTLAINSLAIAGERRLGWRTDAWMWRSIFPVLRDAQLDDPREQEALRKIYRAYRRGGSDRDQTQAALNTLSRFWEE